MNSPAFSGWIKTASLASVAASSTPTTAAGKLYKLDWEYRDLLAQIQACKNRYKSDHMELHKELHGLQARFGPHSTFMRRERKTWMELILEAKAVKKQVTARLVLA